MTTRDFVPLTQFTELKNNFLKLNDRRNKLEIENIKLKELLKECDHMNTNLQNALWQWNEESGLYEECDALEAKINQALGEDK